MINCVVIDDDQVSVEIVSELIKRTGYLKLVNTFNNPISASAVLSSGDVDLIFLDVEMPEMSGIDLIKTLEHKPQIILISSKENYALDAFALQVTDYLLKPLTDYPRFLKAVIKAKEVIDRAGVERSNKEGIFLKVDSLLVNFNLGDINYIEAYGDYVKVHTKLKIYTIYATLKGVEKKLPKNEFIRIHRSYIVRIDQIQNIDNNNLQIHDKIIPVSNTYKPVLMERINTL